MLSISESIEAISSIIDELSIDEKKIAKFRRQCQKILLRSREPNFYLSAIGDFNAGKSTLINAIIKRRLLKAAHLATTAVPTYIYRGENKRLVVKAKCYSGEEYDLTSYEAADSFSKRFGIILPQQIDDRISLLTADKELSMNIKAVNIELPEDELANGLCIIDTPGINSGADYAEKHSEITKHILNEKADAIIVLFPADQAYTESFEKFLKDNAEYFMKDAIFVVTMLDRVDEEERDDVISYVRASLANNFKLKDPQVLACSALLSGKDEYWTEKFEEFEKSLMDRLMQNRQRIVTERLIKLSYELLSSIQSEIVSQKTGFESRLAVLQNHSVPNLISILADISAAAFDEFSKILAAHNEAVESEGTYLNTRMMQNVNSSLNACKTRSEVTAYVKDSLAPDIEAACRDIYAASTQYTEKFNKALSLAISEMIGKLKEYYGEIEGALPENPSLQTSESQAAAKDKLTGLSDMISNYEGKIDIASAIGGAGLAAIILSSLGPIGWIIGGILALIGGDRLFVDASRNKVREPVYEKIPEISKSVVKELCNRAETNRSNVKEALETKKKELVAQYKPLYEAIERQFYSERDELMRRVQLSEETQNRIKAVLRQINQIKENL